MKIIALTILLGVANFAQAQISITPALLSTYLSTETKQTCQIQKTFEHGLIKRYWKTAHAWSVECKDGRQYAVAVETNQEQTAWWLTCELLAQKTNYQCFKKTEVSQ